MQNEIWKPIDGLVGFYEVSSLGRIRSLKRIVSDTIGRERIWPETIIAVSYCKNGYTRFNARLSGKSINKLVHRCVGTAFIPNPEGKPTINHKNGKRDDNRVINLEWATYSENGIDKVIRHGKGLKLTCADVAEIRQMLDQNVNPKIIAAKFGVGFCTVYRIKNKQAWNHA